MKNNKRMFFVFVFVINGVGNVYALEPDKTKKIFQKVEQLFEKINIEYESFKKEVKEKFEKVDQSIFKNEVEHRIIAERLFLLEKGKNRSEGKKRAKSASDD